MGYSFRLTAVLILSCQPFLQIKFYSSFFPILETSKNTKTSFSPSLNSCKSTKLFKMSLKKSSSSFFIFHSHAFQVSNSHRSSQVHSQIFSHPLGLKCGSSHSSNFIKIPSWGGPIELFLVPRLV